MANYLCIFAAPDHHIDFVALHPELLWDYVDGNLPDVPSKAAKRGFLQSLFGGSAAAPQPVNVPDGWPDSEVEMIGPEVNHRNVDLYHLLLNGTADFVEGSGSIFQTWLTNKHGAIDLTGEDYAFKGEQIPALAKLVAQVDSPSVKPRYTEWLRTQGETFEPSEEECDEFAQEFSDFAESLQDVVGKQWGLIWVSS